MPSYTNARWGHPGQSWLTVDIDGVGASCSAVPPDATYAAVVAAGVPIAPAMPSEADYAAAIQAHIEATAKARGYVDAVTCASYATSQHPVWGPEARAFVAWRDSAWTAAFAMLAEVKAGRAPIISASAVVAALPAATWT